MNQIIAVDRVFGFVRDKVGVVVSGELLRVGQRNFCIVRSKKIVFFYWIYEIFAIFAS